MSNESISDVQQIKKLNNIRIFNFDFKDTTKKIKRELGRQSPILLRRHHRVTVENLPITYHPSSDTKIKSNPRHSQSFHVPIWTPKLSDLQQPTSKINRHRSLSIRPRYQHVHSNEKKSSSPNRDLFISPRILNQNIEIIKKANTDESEEIKSNVAVSSDEEEDSTITNCNAPYLTLNDQFSSPLFIPNHQRRTFNNSFHLPPVFEEINDEKY